MLHPTTQELGRTLNSTTETVTPAGYDLWPSSSTTTGTNYFPAGLSDEDDDDDYDERQCALFSRKGYKRRRTKESSGPVRTMNSTLTSPASHQQSSQLSFFAKKKLAWGLYGKSTTRPQDCYLDFLLHRRALNYNRTTPVSTTHYYNVINSSSMPKIPRVTEINDEDHCRRLINITTPSDFEFMMSHLSNCVEIALDSEFHDDHSYKGMISLIQVATSDYDFIIDPFPLHSLIATKLKLILEDPYKIKILFGMANDVRNLQRDFNIYMVSAIDVQIVWHGINGGSMFNFLNLCERLLKTKLEQGVETFADWRTRPLSVNLIKYAQRDVLYLLKIWNHLKFMHPTQRFLEAFNQSKALLTNFYNNNNQRIYNVEEELKVFKGNLNKEKLRTLLLWREKMAKIIDEKPEQMISNEGMSKLCTISSYTENDIFKSTGVWSESKDAWIVSLMKVLKSNGTYFYESEQKICNNCLGYGHAAWGCFLPYSRENKKNYERFNPEAKKRDQNRRRMNRKRKALALASSDRSGPDT